MIIARIGFADAVGVPRRRMSVRLNPAYGPTAGLGHRLVTLAIFDAEGPLVVDAEGGLDRFAPGSVQSVMTYYVGDDLPFLPPGV